MTIFPRGRRTLALVLLAALSGVAACESSSTGQPVSAGRLSSADLNWLDQIHQADMAEVTAGELAETNGGTAGVRAAGAMLVHDHSAFDAKVVQVATKLRVNLVTHLTAEQYAASDELGKELGSEFDHNFTAAMTTGHQKMIAATETEIQRGSSPLVVSLAQQALPELEKHLRTVRAVAGSG
jgi:predicted outer membrane protein